MSGFEGRAALNATEAARLHAAFGALQRGELNAATSIARAVLRDAPASPDAQHLLALCLRNAGDHRGAAQAFERALRAAPDHPDLLNNYASQCVRMGEHARAAPLYQRALSVAPQRSDIWVNLSLAFMALHEHKKALDAAENALRINPNDPRALRASASSRRELDDLEGAEAALRKAVKLDAASGPTWTALGVVLRLRGMPADALDCYKNARATGYASPELQDAEASAQLDVGAIEAAAGGARALTKAAPHYVPGHALLAHILWEHEQTRSPDEDPLAPMEHAVATQPRHHALRLALADLQIEADRPESAIATLTSLRAEADSPQAAAAHAQALERLGQIAHAEAIYAEAIPRMGAPQGMRSAYAHTLIRAGKPDEAVRQALIDTERAPDSQLAWCVLSVAWRLLDDPREHWLCDYERFVMSIEVEPPAKFADMPAFIAALGETLHTLHVAKHEPINQSLRGGTQTAGPLFGRDLPAILAARDALAAGVRKLITRLPSDAGHPFLRRNTGDIRFTGSWSVRLRSAGRHINHFHPKGWISSAFYVQLPPSVHAGGGDHAGWIQFGQPPEEFGLSLTPRRVVQPEVGKLVLFPSYMWHGTVPFTDDASRVTIAFDAAPR